MNKPKPDGQITIHLIAQSKPVVWTFQDMDFWKQDPRGVIVEWPDRKGQTIYPWSSIMCVETLRNSDAYLKLLRRFQEQHDHTWDYSGPDMEGLSWEHCCPEGDSDGCGASRPVLDPSDIHYVEWED